MNFKPMENKNYGMRKTFTVVLVIFLMTGLAVGQEAEDFQTEEPNFVQQFHPTDILTDQSDWESVEANLETQPYTIQSDRVEISPHIDYGYAMSWMFESEEFESDSEIQRLNDEFMRGEVEITHEVYDDGVNYYLVVFEDSSLEEIKQQYTIGAFGDTEGSIETETLSWNEQELYEDEDFDVTDTNSNDLDETDEHYVGIMAQGIGSGADVDLYEVEMNTPQTSYEETFYNGTLSTSWIVPEELQFQNQYADRFDGDADFQISEGGTEGDYHLDITTDGLTGIEFSFDNNIDHYTYFNTDFAVEEGGTVYYGFKDGNTNDVIDEGIKVDNENDVIRPIVNGEEETGTNLYDDDNLENWNSLHQVMNGYDDVWSVSPEIGEQRPYTSLWSETKHDRYYYWANDLGIPNTMSEYDSVVILVESETEETVQASFDKMTYDITPTEADISDPDDGVGIDTGEIESIDDRDEIIDGGRIDSLIRWTANTIGIGLQSTRFLLGLLISGLVGVGIGYREEIESDAIAVVGFGITFFSLTFIGLIPIRFAIIFAGLLIPVGWKIYSSQTKVKA